MIKALLFAAAVATAAPVSDVQSLIATERAFSAAAAQSGVAQAFRRYAASGGVVFRDGKVTKVSEAYANDTGGPKELVWRPQVAGVARSLDIGFDTGPFTLTAANGQQSNGWFVTVWGKQADGTWRFLVDGGIGTGVGASTVPETAPAIVQPGLPGDSSKAFNDVQANEILLSSYSVGVTRSLAPDAWVLRQGHGAAQGKAGLALAKRDPRMAYTPVGGGVSGDGDMAYFYGRAETPRLRNTYLRIWQRRPAGWRVVIDLLIPATA